MPSRAPNARAESCIFARNRRKARPEIGTRQMISTGLVSLRGILVVLVSFRASQTRFTR